MKLREAITAMQCINLDKLSVHETDALSRVLAAARAFACERCGGTGKWWSERDQLYRACNDCREYREKARVE